VQRSTGTARLRTLSGKGHTGHTNRPRRLLSQRVIKRKQMNQMAGDLHSGDTLTA